MTLKRAPWNKGLTKETSPSVAKVADLKRLWWQTTDTQSTRLKIGASSKGRFQAKGAEAHGWKGGRYRVKRDGYVYIYVPSHPYAKKSGKGTGGYMLEHRLVMEKTIGRYLFPDEDVNHRNGIADDNRPENLTLVRHHAHYDVHECPKCGFDWRTR